MIQWLKDLVQGHAPSPVSPHLMEPGGGAAQAVDTDTPTLARQLALVIDLNVCVGCHACVSAC